MSKGHTSLFEVLLPQLVQKFLTGGEQAPHVHFISDDYHYGKLYYNDPFKKLYKFTDNTGHCFL